MRTAVAPLLAAPLVFAAGLASAEPLDPAAPDFDEKVAAIHDRVIAIDTHVDIPPEWATAAMDPGKDGRWQVDIPKMKEGGLDAAFFIVYVGQGPRSEAGHAEAVSKAFQKFAAIRRMTDEQYPDEIALARTADDVVEINGEGKQVALIGIENGYTLGGRIDLVEDYYNLGARYLGLTHNGHNDLGDAAVPRPELGDGPSEHGGLSAFGKEVIDEANRLGIMVDVSHSAPSTTAEAAAYSKAPIIASHSSIHELRAHPRNLDNDGLEAVASKGGVVNIVAFDAYLIDVSPEKIEAIKQIREDMGVDYTWATTASDEQWAEYRSRIAALNEKFPQSNVARLVDHIEYAVKRIGIDHVGISSDFGGGGGVSGWMNATESEEVTRELAKRGYSEEEITKLWGGNLLRVMREVEKVAAELQAASKGG